MTKKRKPTTDAVEILHRRYYEGKPERLAELEEARADDEIARKIYELRTQAGLTQRQLAQRVSTTASVICRLKMPTTKGIPWPCSGASRPPSASASKSALCPCGPRSPLRHE